MHGGPLTVTGGANFGGFGMLHVVGLSSDNSSTSIIKFGGLVAGTTNFEEEGVSLFLEAVCKS